MSFFKSITVGDGANLDAFSRVRVSEPSAVFDAQFTYDLQPLVFEQITANGGTVTYDSINNMAIPTFTSATTGGSAYMQTYEYFRYQPGRGGLVFVTFNFLAATG